MHTGVDPGHPLATADRSHSLIDSCHHSPLRLAMCDSRRIAATQNFPVPKTMAEILSRPMANVIMPRGTGGRDGSTRRSDDRGAGSDLHRTRGRETPGDPLYCGA